MSIDFSIRPVGSPVATSFQPAVSNAAIAGVPTQLPVSQTVTATDSSTSIRNDLPSSTDVSHEAFFDTAAASLVYQSVDASSGAVVNQYPDDATLRRRTYFRSLDLKEAPQRPLATDLRA